MSTYKPRYQNPATTNDKNVHDADRNGSQSLRPLAGVSGLDIPPCQRRQISPDGPISRQPITPDVQMLPLLTWRTVLVTGIAQALGALLQFPP
ncbi:MAG: hypothetical protein OXI52_06715 [Caldilineaceae bacterium]|nr:hypothetical protein [Caldilineaceae bacterium]